MKIYFIHIILLLFCKYDTAQTVLFKAQVIYKNELLKNYTVLVDGKPATTDFSGVLLTAVPSTKMQVRMQTQDKRFIILYPRGGNILIPKDNALITEIILGSFGDDPNLKVYTKILKELNDAGKKPGVNIAPLQKRLDSIEAILNRLNYSKEDIRTAREKQDGIDLFYPEITRALRNYLVQAQDLKNAFKYTSGFAFSSPNALQKLMQAVNDYNPWIEKINESHAVYAQNISDYWQNDLLRKAFEGIADTILNDIHKKNILPFNDIKNNINQYFMGELPGNKNENKIKIQKEIDTALPLLSIKLEALELRINEFINQLSDF